MNENTGGGFQLEKNEDEWRKELTPEQ